MNVHITYIGRNDNEKQTHEYKNNAGYWGKSVFDTHPESGRVFVATFDHIEHNNGITTAYYNAHPTN